MLHCAQIAEHVIRQHSWRPTGDEGLAALSEEPDRCWQRDLVTWLQAG